MLSDAATHSLWRLRVFSLVAHVLIIAAHRRACFMFTLSATVPNTREFADWVGRTKRRKVFVIRCVSELYISFTQVS